MVFHAKNTSIFMLVIAWMLSSTHSRMLRSFLRLVPVQSLKKLLGFHVISDPTPCWLVSRTWWSMGTPQCINQQVMLQTIHRLSQHQNYDRRSGQFTNLDISWNINMANQHLQTSFLADIHQQSLVFTTGLEPSRQKKQHLKGLGEVQQKQVQQ